MNERHFAMLESSINYFYLLILGLLLRHHMSIIIILSHSSTTLSPLCDLQDYSLAA